MSAGENVVCTFVNAPSYPGYARPKAATPIVAPLVPAYQPCASPNRQHASPLAFGSCNPPQRTSGQLTIGTPGRQRRRGQVGQLPEDGAHGGRPAPDRARRRRAPHRPVDYTGELEARFAFKLTDKGSMPLPTNATTQQFGLSVTVPCTATADTTVGATL